MDNRRRPKLGQHFLSSQRYRDRIAQSLRVREDDLLVEIGTGRGAMTELLASRARHVVAIELDAGLAESLRQKFDHNSAIEIVHADILSTDLGGICRAASTKQCFVFGNLPYYITSPILQHVFEFRECIREMSLLMQREVAERVAATPGSRDYGYLSVTVQLFSKPCIRFGVPPGAFSPPPKVQSALVEFEMAARFPAWNRSDVSSFLDFVKLCFAQKRKSVVNNLAARWPRFVAERAIASVEMPSTVRAEQMSLEQLASLQAALYSVMLPDG